MILSFKFALGLLATSSLWASQLVSAKSVFCHYMIGGITEGSGHAELDIDQAQALGFDAFALNVGQPGASWSKSAIRQLFNHADKTGFKLFFSLDFLQTGDINAFTPVLNDYIHRKSYMTAGPNNYPVVSSFGTGNYGPQDFKSWKTNNFQGKIYFLPNTDRLPEFYNPSNWFKTWGSVVDGVFNWETAWPAGSETPRNVSDAFDHAVQTAAHANKKTYMAPLSPFQYKKCCGEHYYRIGEANLPQKMTQLLSLNPDFVEFLTWNDAGEGHYIGNNWPEGLIPEILAYADTKKWPHYGWQPLVKSFISAYKNNRDAAGMLPPDNAQAAGAMWYRPILKTATCQKPRNGNSAIDAVNYAIVVGNNASGLSIRVTSGSKVISEKTAQPGLNYASVPGIRTGSQMVQLLRNGNPIMTASSVVDVAGNSNDCFYNFQVAGLK